MYLYYKYQCVYYKYKHINKLMHGPRDYHRNIQSLFLIIHSLHWKCKLQAEGHLLDHKLLLKCLSKQQKISDDLIWLYI